MADLLLAARLPYEDPRAIALDAEVMETIYHGALEASVELAAAHGAYPRYAGSPLSRGLLQPDLWAAHAPADAPPVAAKPMLSGRWDWGALRAALAEHGARNSTLTALMPTASTSQILGSNEVSFSSAAWRRPRKARKSTGQRRGDTPTNRIFTSATRLPIGARVAPRRVT